MKFPQSSARCVLQKLLPKPLYAHPRFQALVRQMGLPQVGAEAVR